MRTHDEIMQMQERVNRWLKDNACRDDVSETNSHVSKNSQRSSKSRHECQRYHSSLEEVMKNKIKLEELELRAKFLE